MSYYFGGWQWWILCTQRAIGLTQIDRSAYWVDEKIPRSWWNDQWDPVIRPGLGVLITVLSRHRFNLKMEESECKPIPYFPFIDFQTWSCHLINEALNDHKSSSQKTRRRPASQHLSIIDLLISVDGVIELNTDRKKFSVWFWWVGASIYIWNNKFMFKIKSKPNDRTGPKSILFKSRHA